MHSNNKPTYKKLMARGVRAMHQHKRFVQTTMHEVAKDIAKQLQAQVRCYGKPYDSTDGKSLFLQVITWQPIAYQRLEDLNKDLGKRRRDFMLSQRVTDEAGFTVIWHKPN